MNNRLSIPAVSVAEGRYANVRVAEVNICTLPEMDD